MSSVLCMQCSCSYMLSPHACHYLDMTQHQVLDFIHHLRVCCKANNQTCKEIKFSCIRLCTRLALLHFKYTSGNMSAETDDFEAAKKN